LGTSADRKYGNEVQKNGENVKKKIKRKRQRKNRSCKRTIGKIWHLYVEDAKRKA
jgi:hypothetical protein